MPRRNEAKISSQEEREIYDAVNQLGIAKEGRKQDLSSVLNALYAQKTEEAGRLMEKAKTASTVALAGAIGVSIGINLPCGVLFGLGFAGEAMRQKILQLKKNEEKKTVIREAIQLNRM